MIARKAGIAVRHVHRVIAWGNHGDRVYVDLHNARIGNKPAGEIISDAVWTRGELQETVRHRAAEVFQLRGLAPAATAAQAILGTLHSLTTTTPIDRFFSAAVPSDGSYEIPRNVVFSFPLRTEDGKHYSVVDGLYLDEFAQNELRRNVEQLEEEAVLAEKWFG